MQKRTGHWSWAEAQSTYASCSPDAPGRQPGRYITWVPEADKHSTALGNALNTLAHVVLYALVSGRQPVVGRGRVNALMCGPAGAFECGLPYHTQIDIISKIMRSVGRDEGGANGERHGDRHGGGGWRRGSGSGGGEWNFTKTRRTREQGRRHLKDAYEFKERHMVPVHSWDLVYNLTHDVHEG